MDSKGMVEGGVDTWFDGSPLARSCLAQSRSGGVAESTSRLQSHPQKPQSSQSWHALTILIGWRKAHGRNATACRIPADQMERYPKGGRRAFGVLARGFGGPLPGILAAPLRVSASIGT